MRVEKAPFSMQPLHSKGNDLQPMTLRLTASEEEKKSQEDTLEPSSTIVEKRSPLSFRFCGYTLWLEVEQIENDLSNAMQMAVDFHGLHPIPEPHVTLIYGMTHLSQEEVLHIFQNDLKPFLSQHGWAQHNNSTTQDNALQTIGLLADVTFDGVNGENMDIAWSELTFATSEHHERLLDELYSIFQFQRPESNQRWKPHLSLAYDNPTVDTPVTIARTLELVHKYPTLLTVPYRKILGISLWDTHGTMSEWKCLDRFHF